MAFNDCAFVDKYNNVALKIIKSLYSLKQHVKSTCRLNKKGTLSFKRINDEFTFMKWNFNNKSIYGINNESLKNLKNEYEY